MPFFVCLFFFFFFFFFFFVCLFFVFFCFFVVVFFFSRHGKAMFNDYGIFRVSIIYSLALKITSIKRSF